MPPLNECKGNISVDFRPLVGDSDFACDLARKEELMVVAKISLISG